MSIRENDIGSVLFLTITENGEPMDLSSSTAIVLVMDKPSGETISVTPELVGDGTDGLVSYTSQEGDFDQSGLWKVQAIVTMSGDAVFHSDIGKFTVYSNLGH